MSVREGQGVVLLCGPPPHSGGKTGPFLLFIFINVSGLWPRLSVALGRGLCLRGGRWEPPREAVPPEPFVNTAHRRLWEVPRVGELTTISVAEWR